MSVELTIVIKDQEKKRLTLPFHLYESFSLSADDPVIKRCIEAALKEFNGEPEDVIVKAQLTIK